MVDQIARAYSIPPHEVLEMTPYQFSLAYLCITARAELVGSSISSSQVPPIPVLVLGSL